MSKKRKAINLHKNLKQQRIEDDVARFAAMTPAEVDDYIRRNGGDPEGIRARGGAFAKRLMARREANAWQAEAVKKQVSFQATVAAAKSRVLLARDELLARIAAAMNHPRVTAAGAASFRQKIAEAATDEQLQEILDQLEMLLRLDEK
jgi:hypothetical protein